MKRMLSAIAIVAVVVAAVRLLLGNRPDVSSVPPYAPYSQVAFDFAPSWLPDGSRILFSRMAAGGREESLWIVPAPGGAANKFLDDAALPAWSPDGKSVAFSSSRGLKWYDPHRFIGRRPIHLWIADANGQNLRKLTTAPENALDAVWSPDGKKIAFTAFPGPRVMVVAADGGEPKRFADGLSPAWSPEGKRIAYYSCESLLLGAPCRIRIATLDGAQEKTLGSLVNSLSATARPILDWSRDGKRLLTTHIEEGGRIPVVINVDDDRVERSIQEAGSVIWARWSPDGERIAYSFSDTSHPPDIEVKNLATTERRRLSEGATYKGAQLVRFASDGDLEIPAWLYLPSNPANKHLAIIWLHGGAPGAGSMPNEFDNAIQYFVANGFAVLAPNYRGSIGFGEALARPSQGIDPLPDIVAAVRYLRKLDSIDPSRIALVGFSFGGLMTLRTITEHPGLVAAAVDFFGPSDLVAYYRNNPGARPVVASLLGGSPEQKPAVYRALSPIHFVDRITIPLLVLYGARDPDYDDANELRKALEKNHKDFEYITYRFAGHGFEGSDDANANQQTMRFLLTHLRGAK